MIQNDDFEKNYDFILHETTESAISSHYRHFGGRLWPVDHQDSIPGGGDLEIYILDQLLLVTLYGFCEAPLKVVPAPSNYGDGV